VAISDTTPKAQEVWLRMQRSLTGEQRLLKALELSRLVKEMMKAGIRRDHPDWNEEQIGRELLRLAFLPHPLPPRFR
jgi:hypothetical protein